MGFLYNIKNLYYFMSKIRILRDAFFCAKLINNQLADRGGR